VFDSIVGVGVGVGVGGFFWQDALSARGHALFVCTINPTANHFDPTLVTLRFAHRIFSAWHRLDPNALRASGPQAGQSSVSLSLPTAVLHASGSVAALSALHDHALHSPRSASAHDAALNAPSRAPLMLPVTFPPDTVIGATSTVRPRSPFRSISSRSGFDATTTRGGAAASSSSPPRTRLGYTYNRMHPSRQEGKPASAAAPDAWHNVAPKTRRANNRVAFDQYAGSSDEDHADDTSHRPAIAAAEDEHQGSDDSHPDGHIHSTSSSAAGESIRSQFTLTGLDANLIATPSDVGAGSIYGVGSDGVIAAARAAWFERHDPFSSTSSSAAIFSPSSVNHVDTFVAARSAQRQSAAAQDAALRVVPEQRMYENGDYQLNGPPASAPNPMKLSGALPVPALQHVPAATWHRSSLTDSGASVVTSVSSSLLSSLSSSSSSSISATDPVRVNSVPGHLGASARKLPVSMAFPVVGVDSLTPSLSTSASPVRNALSTSTIGAAVLVSSLALPSDSTTVPPSTPAAAALRSTITQYTTEPLAMSVTGVEAFDEHGAASRRWDRAALLAQSVTALERFEVVAQAVAGPVPPNLWSWYRPSSTYM
jgi:hypothetical protein